MTTDPVRHFDREAGRLAEVYEGTTFDLVHPYLTGLLPPPPAKVLDIGAGSGRDSVALAKMGYEVTAVEPSAAMRREAIARHPGGAVEWLDDRLPYLRRLGRRRFDIILLSAVWMYLARDDRREAIDRLHSLCNARGTVALSVRSTKSDEAGDFQVVDIEATVAAFVDRGFQPLKRQALPDVLGRLDKEWTAFVFELDMRGDNSL